ncbi:hypothetical protein ACEVQ6_23250 [Ciceribacter sp. sgz301302]
MSLKRLMEDVPSEAQHYFRNGGLIDNHISRLRGEILHYDPIFTPIFSSMFTANFALTSLGKFAISGLSAIASTCTTNGVNFS